MEGGLIILAQNQIKKRVLFFGEANGSFLKNCIFIAGLGVIVALFLSLIQPIHVSGISMENTLDDGQIVWATHLLKGKIQKNDIVIAETPYYKGALIKRVIAGPGDWIEIKNGKVYVNNKEIKEKYIKEKMREKNLKKIQLKNDEFFLMGDNRNNSMDSRKIGPVKEKDIIYKVVGV